MPNLEIENQFKGAVGGVDEVGRGPWAGPVVAAVAVFLDPPTLPAFLLASIQDSKKLSKIKREGVHAELMALIWGPRFDRQQAHSLLLAMTDQPSAVWLAATQAADGFDRLKPIEQQRLRHLIVRHQRRCHNFPCPEFS